MCYEELKKENMRALCVWWTLLHAVPWETVPCRAHEGILI